MPSVHRCIRTLAFENAKHTHTHAHTHAQTHKHTNTHTHIDPYRYTYTHTHTHKHTHMPRGHQVEAASNIAGFRRELGTPAALQCLSSCGVWRSYHGRSCQRSCEYVQVKLKVVLELALMISIIH